MYEVQPDAEQLAALAALFERGPVAVLTGAGISTESGIPDYRGPNSSARPRRPIQYQEFMKSPRVRNRYWARSMLGWPRFAAAKPNVGHTVLAEFEARGLVSGVITQNVDSLHTVAGSVKVVELHGALRDVICLDCRRLVPRAELQHELERNNAELVAAAVTVAPDGDADLDDALLGTFRLMDCGCGGTFKPHVVFFGENVPPERVGRAHALVRSASALLVVGSSLTVYSGLRFVRAAAEQKKPIAIVTLGPTRGDAQATLRLDAGVGLTLFALRQQLIAAATG